jgi:carboxypeptidase Taq
MEEQLQQLRIRLAQVDDLERAAAVLDWDQQTYMPPAADAARARQLGTLHRLAHEIFVAEETGRLLADLQTAAAGLPADSDEARLLQVTQRDYALAVKIPASFVAEMAEATALGHHAWVRAKSAADFKLFEANLERMVALARQRADYLGFDEHPYDALLDLYEPGMKTSQVAAIFGDLRPQITNLLRGIIASRTPVDDSVLHRHYDAERQRTLVYDLMQRFGYDFTRGRHDAAPHPFCTSFSMDDVRITSRIVEDNLAYFFFSALHETGHALYEQGVSPSLGRSPLGQGASLGVHESQSRLWENLVGRSRPFWNFFYPQVQTAFPDALGDVSLDAFYRIVNRVQPSFIRIEADEVTYNLHIMLRFELETGLLDGSLRVAELPKLWNERMEAYLGLTPPNDAVGVLQDVHWSQALIGYFPTYTLGNLLAAQFFAVAQQQFPTLWDEIERGDFSSLLTWLRSNIHTHGRKFTANELLQRTTGGGLDAGPFIAYLTAKFTAL